MTKLTALRALMAEAERAGISPHLLRAAASELVELIDRPAPDPRRLASWQKAERIRHALDAGAQPAEVRERFGLKRSAFYRLVKLSRESRAAAAVERQQRATEGNR